MAGSYEYGNEPSGCIKFWKLFGWFWHYQTRNKDSGKFIKF